MRKYRVNKLAMYVVVAAFMAAKKTIWEALVALGAALGAFQARIDTINDLEQSRLGGTKGVTADKKASRQSLTLSALTVAGAVRAFASKTGNGELFAKVNYSRSDLRKVRDAELGNVCQSIFDRANANLAVLADYGLTAETLAAFKSVIDEYTGHSTKPRTTRSAGRAAGEMLKVEFAAADRVLEHEIDGLVAKFQASEPEFYAGYLAAREIMDIPGNKKTPTGPDQPQPPQPQ